MEFNIKSKFRKTEITRKDDQQKYQFVTKLFTHNSLLADMDGFVLVSMKRKSWWNMDFKVTTQDGIYELNRHLGSRDLIHVESQTRLYDMGTSEFYIKRNFASKVEIVKYDREIELEIKETKHWQAILAATCLEYNFVTRGG